MTITCPKCHHTRTTQDDPLIPDYQCPACGVVYAKVGRDLSKHEINQAANKFRGATNKVTPLDAAQDIAKTLFKITTAILKFIVVVLMAFDKNKSLRKTGTKSKDQEYEYESLEIDKDSWENFHEYADVSYNVAVSLSFDYQDANGKKTHRTVDVRKFGYTDQILVFEGFCRLRKASRTFVGNRIKNCVDASTGEILQDVKRYLIDIYENSVEYSLDNLFERYFDALCVLLFIAKADEQFRKEERAIFTQFCIDAVNDNRITSSMLDSIIPRLSLGYNMRRFKLRVNKLAGFDEGTRRKIVECACAMVATQSHVSPIEQESLDFLVKKLSERVPR